MNTTGSQYKDFEVEKSDENLMCLGDTPITGTVLSFWPSSGKISREFEYEGGLLHGHALHRHKNGQVSEINYYDNGTQLYTQDRFLENGVCIEAWTQDDQADTYTKNTFYENGNPKDSITKYMSSPQYKQGSYMEYHENGNLKKHSQFLDGIMVGVNTSFDEDGSPINQSIYNNGQELIQLISGSLPTHFDNDTLAELAEMLNDSPPLLDESLLSDGNQKIIDFIASNSESPEFINEGLSDEYLFSHLLAPRWCTYNEAIARATSSKSPQP